MPRQIIPATALLLAGALGNAASGGTELLMPDFDAALGRTLFASKGCVVCHSVNGIGGEDAPVLDFDKDTGPMNPFEFAARMWRGAGAMIYMQEEELGGQIELTGPELAAIIAFAHDPEEQARFSMDDIPEYILDVMHGASEEHEDDEADADHDDAPDSGEDHD